MDDLQPLGDIDVITGQDLRALASVPGPCVSAFLPTHRHGPDTRTGPVRLRRLVQDARAQLTAAGLADGATEELLAPMEALLDDEPFWQHQAGGLALFTASDRMVWLRLAEAFEECLVVGAAFRLRALLPILAGDGVFDILALSQNDVRLFRANRVAITQLDTGGTPRSMHEALAHEDPERQLQVHSAGGRTSQFHGHGAGEELDKAALERYFRAVDRGIEHVLGAQRPPLVLASVGYYLPIYRSVGDHPAILDRVVEGNPERLDAAELHRRALGIVEPLLVAPRDRAVARYREVAGTGRTAGTIEEVATAAARGEIDALLVLRDAPPRWGTVGPGPGVVTVVAERSAKDSDLVDLAVRDTVRHGGEVHAVEELDAPDGVAAVLRF